MYVKYHLDILKICSMQTKCILAFFFGTGAFSATLPPVFTAENETAPLGYLFISQ